MNLSTRPFLYASGISTEMFALKNKSRFLIIAALLMILTTGLQLPDRSFLVLSEALRTVCTCLFLGPTLCPLLMDSLITSLRASRSRSRAQGTASQLRGQPGGHYTLCTRCTSVCVLKSLLLYMRCTYAVSMKRRLMSRCSPAAPPICFYSAKNHPDIS